MEVTLVLPARATYCLLIVGGELSKVNTAKDPPADLTMRRTTHPDSKDVGFSSSSLVLSAAFSFFIRFSLSLSLSCSQILTLLVLVTLEIRLD